MEMSLGGIECLEEAGGLVSKLCVLSSKGCVAAQQPVPIHWLKTTNVNSKNIFSLIPESCTADLLPYLLPVPLPGGTFSSSMSLSHWATREVPLLNVSVSLTGLGALTPKAMLSVSLYLPQSWAMGMPARRCSVGQRRLNEWMQSSLLGLMYSY